MGPKTHSDSQGSHVTKKKFKHPNLDKKRSHPKAGPLATDTEAKKAASFGISEGDRLLRRPLHQVTAEISRGFLRERAQATLTAMYVGERRDLDPTTFATVTADDYLVVNLSSSFLPVSLLSPICLLLCH